MPTCYEISAFFDGGNYKTESGGNDEIYFMNCGGSTDIVVISGEPCGFECVGYLRSNDYDDVCDQNSQVDFLLEGNYGGSTLFIGYMDDSGEPDLDCNNEMIISTEAPTPSPTKKLVTKQPTKKPTESPRTPEPTPGETPEPTEDR